MLNQDQLLLDLARDEGFRPYVYDDANGKLIVPGYTLVGHPTVAYGWALDVTPCDQELGQLILNHQATDKYNELLKALPWITDKPEPVQRALCNMAFNLGVKGLIRLFIFVNLLQQGKYSAAADDLETTLWYKQVGQRAVRISQLIRSAQA